MFCLVLQIVFSHPAVIFLKIPFISDHLTSAIPSSSVSKINGLHTNATKHWGRGYLSNQPPVQRATSLAKSCVFMQLENMPRLLRKQTDILTCFHYLFCLLVNAVCIISQLSFPFTRKSVQLQREEQENSFTMDFRKLHMKSDVHLAKGQYILYINCTIFMPNEDVAHFLRQASKIQ